MADEINDPLCKKTVQFGQKKKEKLQYLFCHCIANGYGNGGNNQ